MLSQANMRLNSRRRPACALLFTHANGVELLNTEQGDEFLGLERFGASRGQGKTPNP